MNASSESTTLRESSDIALGGNESFWIKRFFLSFLQAYFAQHSKYTWTTGVTTKIVIVDKYSLDLNLAKKHPTIVLSRGYNRWMGTSIGQYFRRSLFSDNAEFTDLMAGSVTINCMAKNGMVCEELAQIVHNVLRANKVELRRKGLHSLNGVTIGEERSLEADSENVLTVVPVSVEFTKQSYLQFTEDFYATNVKLAFSGTDYGAYSGQIFQDTVQPLQLYENRDYTVYASGIIFASGYAPPLGSSITMRYIEGTSLSEVAEIPSGIIDGTNRTFAVSQEIYGYSPLLASILNSGITINND